MYCTHCGTAHPDGAPSCAQCGQPIRQFLPLPPVPNHLVPAILTTLCCCMPAGIVALIYAAQVNTKLNAGDVAGAQAASANARTWMIVAFVVGLLMAAGLALVTRFD